jgi:hypothetical protein
MPLLISSVTPAGTGTVTGSNGVFSGNDPITLNVTPSGGSTFAGWSCVGTGGFSYSTGNQIGGFNMPAENVTCTATFNSTAVSAPVDSPLALSLVFLGIAAVAGFQRWRKRV